MSTLSLQGIGLRPTQLKAIEKKAKFAGKSAAEYVRLLIERDLLADLPFDEILRPIREDFRQSGITESQLDEIVRRARHQSRSRASAPKNRKARQRAVCRASPLDCERCLTATRLSKRLLSMTAQPRNV